MSRGTWWVMVHRVPKSPTQLKWLSMHACMPIDLPELTGLVPVTPSPRGKGPGVFSGEVLGSWKGGQFPLGQLAGLPMYCGFSSPLGVLVPPSIS